MQKIVVHPEYLMAYRDRIVDDYGRILSDDDYHNSAKVSRFSESIKFEYLKKYIRVMVNGSAHSFISLGLDGKFRHGDILKSASYRAPAKNVARGNFHENNWFDRVRWTGVY